MRLEAAVLVGGLGEAIEDGRDGKSCDNRSDAPDVLLRVGVGREPHGRVPCSVTGEPTRRADGTELSEGLLKNAEEPGWRGDGT